MRKEQAKRLEAALKHARTALDKVNEIRLKLALGSETDLNAAKVKNDQVFVHLIIATRALNAEIFRGRDQASLKAVVKKGKEIIGK